MSKIKVKNKGSQIFIGPKLCLNGKVTPVDEKDLESFCKTPGGSALLNVSLFIYDEDFQRQKAATQGALKQQAEATVRQELTPVLEKEIMAKLEKKYAKRIEVLKIDMDLKDGLIADLKKKLETVDNLVSSDDDSGDSDDGEFVFDPESHTVEHRGAGKYYVMDLEDNKVLDRALTKDERAEFEAMQKAE